MHAKPLCCGCAGSYCRQFRVQRRYIGYSGSDFEDFASQERHVAPTGYEMWREGSRPNFAPIDAGEIFSLSGFVGSVMICQVLQFRQTRSTSFGRV